MLATEMVEQPGGLWGLLLPYAGQHHSDHLNKSLNFQQLPLIQRVKTCCKKPKQASNSSPLKGFLCKSPFSSLSQSGLAPLLYLNLGKAWIRFMQRVSILYFQVNQLKCNFYLKEPLKARFRQDNFEKFLRSSFSVGQGPLLNALQLKYWEKNFTVVLNLGKKPGHDDQGMDFFCKSSKSQNWVWWKGLVMFEELG